MPIFNSLRTCTMIRRVTRNQSTEGVILKNGRVGEIHKSVTFLSPELGLANAIAHGAYKGKSRLGGVTEIFSRSKIALYHDPVRGSYKITEVEPIYVYENVRRDLQKYYIGSLWTEVILRTYAGGGDFDKVFRLVCESMLLLDRCPSQKNDAVLALFLFRYVDALGYLPDFGSCAKCGEHLKESDAWYISKAGSIRCVRCAGEFAPKFAPGARRYLSYASRRPVEEVLMVELDGASSLELKRAMLSIVQHIIGGALNTLRGAGGIV